MGRSGDPGSDGLSEIFDDGNDFIEDENSCDSDFSSGEYLPE